MSGSPRRINAAGQRPAAASVQTPPQRGQRLQPSLQLVRSGRVACPDADLELVETFGLTPDDLRALVLGSGPQGAKEGGPGVGGPFEAQRAGNGRVGAPLLSKRQCLAVGVAAGRLAGGPVPLLPALEAARPVRPASPRQGAPIWPGAPSAP